MAQPRVTLDRIAELCKVSQSTASRALRDHPHISPAVKKSVRTVARSLGYRPSLVARSLVRGKSDMVAFVRGDSDFFWEDFSRIIHQTLRARDLIPIDCMPSETGELDLELFESLLDHMVSGVIWKPRGTEDVSCIAARMAAASAPLVVVNMVVPECRSTFVYSDDVAGARMAAEYLVNEGHREIAMIAGPQTIQLMRWRKQGFLMAIDQAGIPRNHAPVAEIPYGYRNAYEHARRILSEADHVTAILASRDEDAWGALDAARDLGIRVPEQLRIIGYGDYLPKHYTRCRLTTVSQCRAEIAKKAVEAFFRGLEDDYRPVHEAIAIPASLVIGET